MLAAHRDSAMTAGLLDRRGSHSSSLSPDEGSSFGGGSAAAWGSGRGPSPLCRSMRKLSISTFSGLSSRYEVDPRGYLGAGGWGGPGGW